MTQSRFPARIMRRWIQPGIFVLAGLFPFKAHADVVVYVAFDEPIPHTITYANGILDEIDCDTPSTSTSGVVEPYKSQILSQLTSVFNQAGVTNIQFTGQAVADPDVTVFVDTRRSDGPDGFLVDECNGLTMDQFNKRRGETVLVNLSVQPSGITGVSPAVQVIAHEVGHAFGLRHAIAKPDNGDNPKGIMRPGGYEGDYQSCFDDCDFLNGVWPVMESRHLFWILFGAENVPVPDGDTTNAVYHLSRYVEGKTHAELEANSICPGTWDITDEEREQFLLQLTSPSQPGSSATETEGGLGPSVVLFDVVVNEWYGNDVPRRLAKYDSISAEELKGERWRLHQNSRFELLAASAPEGPKDITLAGIGPGNQPELDTNPLIGGTGMALFQVSGPEAHVMLAGYETDVTPEKVFVSSFEQDAESLLTVEGMVSTTTEVVSGETTGSPCTPLVTLQKVGGGQGIINSNPAGLDCDESCSTVEQAYPVGTEIKLSADWSPGTQFIQWADESDVCGGETKYSVDCEFTVQEETLVIAEFEPPNCRTDEFSSNLWVVECLDGNNLPIYTEFLSLYGDNSADLSISDFSSAEAHNRQAIWTFDRNGFLTPPPMESTPDFTILQTFIRRKIKTLQVMKNDGSMTTITAADIYASRGADTFLVAERYESIFYPDYVYNYSRELNDCQFSLGTWYQGASRLYTYVEGTQTSYTNTPMTDEGQCPGDADILFVNGLTLEQSLIYQCIQMGLFGTACPLAP